MLGPRQRVRRAAHSINRPSKLRLQVLPPGDEKNTQDFRKRSRGASGFVKREGGGDAASSGFLSCKSTMRSARIKHILSVIEVPSLLQSSVHLGVPLNIFTRPLKEGAVCTFCFRPSTWSWRTNCRASEGTAGESRRPRFSLLGGEVMVFPLGRSWSWLKMQKDLSRPRAAFRSI